MATAKALTHTCYQMYATTETGLAPEIVARPRVGTREGVTKKDFEPKNDAAHYLLRPEGKKILFRYTRSLFVLTISLLVAESLFILNKITGDSIYR